MGRVGPIQERAVAVGERGAEVFGWVIDTPEMGVTVTNLPKVVL